MAINLNKREKYSIYAASGFICLFILIQFVIFPFLDKSERLKRTLQAKTKSLGEIILLKTEYETIKKNFELSKISVATREKGFSLFSFLDTLAGETGIKDQITYMKPSTSAQKNSPYKISLVEMKLQAITLEQLIAYLHRVETSENMVNVKRISITKTTSPEGFINTVLKVETIES